MSNCAVYTTRLLLFFFFLDPNEMILNAYFLRGVTSVAIHNNDTSQMLFWFVADELFYTMQHLYSRLLLFVGLWYNCLNNTSPK